MYFIPTLTVKTNVYSACCYYIILMCKQIYLFLKLIFKMYIFIPLSNTAPYCILTYQNTTMLKTGSVINCKLNKTAWRLELIRYRIRGFDIFFFNLWIVLCSSVNTELYVIDNLISYDIEWIITVRQYILESIRVMLNTLAVYCQTTFF